MTPPRLDLLPLLCELPPLGSFNIGLDDLPEALEALDGADNFLVVLAEGLGQLGRPDLAGRGQLLEDNLRDVHGPLFVASLPLKSLPPHTRGNFSLMKLAREEVDEMSGVWVEIDTASLII